MPDRTQPKSWRRRLRLSVRGLMVLVLILGGGLGWFIYRARVQQEAVAAIQRVGGGIAYSWQWSSGAPVFPPPKPPWPIWVRRILGPDFLDTVAYVRLQGNQCDDEALRAACRLPWLEELIVVDTSVTDSGAENLRQLKNLRSLDLRLNRITARALRHIGGMTEMRELKLAMKRSPVPLRDEDVAFLKRLTRLESLMLPSADLTDAWLVYIEDLKNLKRLQLYDMAITADGLHHLRALSNLTTLSLHGTRLTSIEPLRPHTKITYLCLAYTPVDDSVLAVLHSWPQLRDLDMRRTNITDAGVAALMKANSQVKVRR
jgi:Leucine Rich repeat